MQLNPPIPVETPLGYGFAHLLEDGRAGADAIWQVFIARTGESWWFGNRYIRLSSDITVGIGPISPIEIPRGLERHVERYKTNGWL